MLWLLLLTPTAVACRCQRKGYQYQTHQTHQCINVHDRGIALGLGQMIVYFDVLVLCSISTPALLRHPFHFLLLIASCLSHPLTSTHPSNTTHADTHLLLSPLFLHSPLARDNPMVRLPLRLALLNRALRLPAFPPLPFPLRSWCC